MTCNNKVIKDSKQKLMVLKYLVSSIEQELIKQEDYNSLSQQDFYKKYNRYNPYNSDIKNDCLKARKILIEIKKSF